MNASITFDVVTTYVCAGVRRAAASLVPISWPKENIFREIMFYFFRFYLCFVVNFFNGDISNPIEDDTYLLFWQNNSRLIFHKVCNYDSNITYIEHRNR